MPIPGGSRATRKLSFVGRISIDKRYDSIGSAPAGVVGVGSALIPGHFRLGRLNQAAGGGGGRIYGCRIEFLLSSRARFLTRKVASFVWRCEEAWENRVLEFAAEGIVACFSRFRMRRHTLSASAGAHRRIELECWLRSVNEVAPFSCSATDL